MDHLVKYIYCHEGFGFRVGLLLLVGATPSTVYVSAFFWHYSCTTPYTSNQNLLPAVFNNHILNIMQAGHLHVVVRLVKIAEMEGKKYAALEMLNSSQLIAPFKGHRCAASKLKSMQANARAINIAAQRVGRLSR